MATADAGLYNEAIAVVIDEKIRNARTVLPGKVAAVARQALGEMDVDFDAGIGTRKNGEECGDGLAPSAPVLFPGGGGFSMRWPLFPQDEVVAICSDRNTERWRATKLVGQAHSFSGRHHDLSDALVLPVRITPPTPTAPATVTDETTDWVLTGPLGEAMRVGSTGAIAITKSGGLVATITLTVGGSMMFEVETGQTVMIGDELAEALVKINKLIANMSTALAAGIATPPTPMAGNNGSLAMTNFQIAWDAANASNPMGTTKALGT